MSDSRQPNQIYKRLKVKPECHILICSESYCLFSPGRERHMLGWTMVTKLLDSVGGGRGEGEVAGRRSQRGHEQEQRLSSNNI